MSIIKKLNPLKTRIFQFLTGSLKNSKSIAKLATVDRNSIKRILVTRPNHRLGNQLLTTPLVLELETEFPNAKIDVLVNGSLSNILFANYSSVGSIFNLPKKPFKNLRNYISVSFKIITKKYDLAVVGCNDSNSSKIFVKLSRAKYKLFDAGEDEQIPVTHISKIPIYNLRHVLGNKNATQEETYPEIDIKLSNDEIAQGQAKIREFFDNKNPTICVFTNATGAKKLSKEWWSDFSTALEAALPNVNILEMLPKENTSQLDFKYTSYYSEEIREMAAVIENCKVFIGADSGVMHLASATNSAVIGLFNGSTNPAIYSPYGKNKGSLNITKVTVDAIANQVKTYVEK